jgi:hypothetical protein
MKLVKITRWENNEIEPNTTELRYYGTLYEESNRPRFLSFDDFANWPIEYDAYHEVLPDGCSWQIISEEELFSKIENVELNEENWDLSDHIYWVLNSEEDFGE